MIVLGDLLAASSASIQDGHEEESGRRHGVLVARPGLATTLTLYNFRFILSL